ncbi:MAG: ATP-binding protein [Nocardioides sp.]|nr:ATP-binding protein [Nocardioides sp.]
MPLNRPALRLPSDAKAVQLARDWVSDVCAEIDRDELVECARLGVSELVSNALFHGTDPVSVRVRGTREHPRVEVLDGSTEPPLMPTSADIDAADEDILLTVGRGLSIVARVAKAWGADIDADGKAVWFTPSAEVREDDGATGVITGPPPRIEVVQRERRTGRSVADTAETPVEISVLGVPLSLYSGFQNHFRELRREVRLLSLAHAHEYPLATTLSSLFGILERQLLDGIGNSELTGAIADGEETADLHVRMPRTAAETLERFLELLDLADEFCRQERLLALARTPDQVVFQRWFLGEYLRQAEGGPPAPWPESKMLRETVSVDSSADGGGARRQP